jgi:hypothetical protein
LDESLRKNQFTRFSEYFRCARSYNWADIPKLRPPNLTSGCRGPGMNSHVENAALELTPGCQAEVVRGTLEGLVATVKGTTEATVLLALKEDTPGVYVRIRRDLVECVPEDE